MVQHTIRLALFVLSAFFGAFLYLVTVSFFPVPERAAGPPLGITEVNAVGFDGEFKLFAQTRQAVDLGHDSAGSVYLLNRDGRILKSTAGGRYERERPGFHEVTSPGFLPSRGCSAIAFHPNFLEENAEGYGMFYLAFAEKNGSGALTFDSDGSPSHEEVICEFSCRYPGSGVFQGTSREVIRIAAPAGNDGAAITDLAFDHRGFLYIGIADSGDPASCLASELESVYGKILRINPLEDRAGRSSYSVPRSNPFFLVRETLPELWSYGLRNPHTVSFDPFREWVCISDSGRDFLEEINVSDSGAEFFGWNLSEGSFFYPLTQERTVSKEIVSPQIEYVRGNILEKNVGGIIYRGERFPYLDGNAIFADEKGRLLAANISSGEAARKLSLLIPGGDLGGRARSLKEGPSGELFVFCENGNVFELCKASTAQSTNRTSRLMLASAGDRPPIPAR